MTTATVLGSPLQQSHAEALSLSQQTEAFFRKYTSTKTSIPLPLLSHPDSAEIWNTYEKLLLACLRTGDDKAAHLCLEKLVDRFGATNERVMGLRGLYQEAVALDDSGLERILQEYQEVLAEDPVNTPVMKRRIALFRSLSRTADAIEALVELLEASPTDIEAWTELSDLYIAQGLFSQAEFCLEEVLLVAPNAWNIHARLGEVLFMSATSSSEGSITRILAESMRRFCRSVELCDGYLRGYYGLKMASDLLLEILPRTPKNSSAIVSVTENGEDIPLPSMPILEKLNEQSTSKLAEMIIQARNGGYNPFEVSAVKELLLKSSQSVQR